MKPNMISRAQLKLIGFSFFGDPFRLSPGWTEENEIGRLWSRLMAYADAVSYSLYHFCRIFNQTVHHAPYDYLMRRRLTTAAGLLLAGDLRITDIAFAYQFGSPESFSRAFKRMFRQLPMQWRKQGLPDPRVLMRPITAAHLAQRNRPAFHRPRLITRPAMTIVGLMTVIQAEVAVPTKTTQTMARLRQQLSQPATHTIHHYPDFWAEQGKPVLVGIVAETGRPPLVSQAIPAYEYACFPLPELAAERPLLTDYIYQTWLPQSGYKLAAPLELEQEAQLLVPIVPDR